MGRVFRTLDDNGSYDGTTTTHDYYDVRIQLSINSKQLKVTNALNQDTVFKYNLLPPDKGDNSVVTYTDSPDGGWRRMLQNVLGNMVLAWDERGHVFRSEYDDLQRPIKKWVTPAGSTEFLNTENIYGESQGSVKNLKGQLYQQKDQSGILTFEEYDFKGNLIKNKRELATIYNADLDWSGTVNLESESFINEISFDALNRPILSVKADGTEEYLSYNKASLLIAKSIKVRGTGLVEDVITDIKYNSRGQRTDIFYANASKSRYEYNAATFRLERLLTTRNTGADILQDLNYTFDAVGNIVEQVDDAQQTHYFQNSVVEPKSKYEYDALYRLKKATGREHAGQGQSTEADIDIKAPVPHANQSDAVINYTETYVYDEIGNIEKLVHTALNNNWTRGYAYDSSSNYLLKTSMPGDTIADPLTYSSVYTYDVHGNMKSMPHLNDMIWNANDKLTEVDLGSAGTVHYRYDSEGNRVRKVIENGSVKKERIYIDGVEIWREYRSGVIQKERETLSISDDSKVFLRVETLTTDGGTLVSSPTSNWRYQYANHLESACLELDSAANIISYEEYHPFGTSSYRSGNNAAEVSMKLYRYNGKERDEETGLYNYGMRYYCAWLCRFLSVDPKKDNYPFQNSFAYAANNPATLMDVNGESPGGGDEDDPPPIDFDLAGSPEYQEANQRKGVKHTVKKGDTLTALAEKYGTTVDALRELNPQTQIRKLEDQINIDESLTIPEKIKSKKFMEYKWNESDTSKNTLSSPFKTGISSTSKSEDWFLGPITLNVGFEIAFPESSVMGNSWTGWAGEIGLVADVENLNVIGTTKEPTDPESFAFGLSIGVSYTEGFKRSIMNTDLEGSGSESTNSFLIVGSSIAEDEAKTYRQYGLSFGIKDYGIDLSNAKWKTDTKILW